MIAVQDVFDPTQNFLIECEEKDHTLDGQTFCDELLVLPPGVYEIVVQSMDPSCHTEQDHYKVIVEPNQTTEIEVTMICGDQNGGLDVIVTEWNQPRIDDIDFFFVEGGVANKFICIDDEDVRIAITVSDADTPCDELTVNWTAVNSLDQDVTATLLSEPLHEAGTCVFSIRVDSSQPAGDYEVTVSVSDGTTPTTTLTFPLHLIECEVVPPQCLPEQTVCGDICCEQGEICIDDNICASQLACLDEAATFVVLGLNGGNMIINSADTVVGDIGYSSGVTSNTNQKIGGGIGDDVWAGGAYVHSNVASFVYNAGNYLPSDGINMGAAVDARLDEANSDAQNAAALWSALTPDITLGAVTSDPNITRQDTVTVVQISSLLFVGDTFTINGSPGGDDYFIIQVLGDFSMSQSQIVLNNVEPERVVWVFPNASDIDIAGNASRFYGTILATNPGTSLIYHNDAIFEGAIIAPNLNLHSDFNITLHPNVIPCPPFP